MAVVRMLKPAKTLAVKSRAQVVNQLKAVIVAADPDWPSCPAAPSRRTAQEEMIRCAKRYIACTVYTTITKDLANPAMRDLPTAP